MGFVNCSREQTKSLRRLGYGSTQCQCCPEQDEHTHFSEYFVSTLSSHLMSLRCNYWFCCFGGSISSEKLGFLPEFLSIFLDFKLSKCVLWPLGKVLCSVILQVACPGRWQNGFFVARAAGMCWGQAHGVLFCAVRIRHLSEPSCQLCLGFLMCSVWMRKRPTGLNWQHRNTLVFQMYSWSDKKWWHVLCLNYCVCIMMKKCFMNICCGVN